MRHRIAIRVRACGRPAREESGIALVLTLLVLLAVTIAVVATIELTRSNNRSTYRLNGETKAYALAEPGVNNVMLRPDAGRLSGDGGGRGG
jgi:Tfp pilus assembly protein PilX